jgi:pimeloyl-ACP methyl ester carboxylesterase
MTNLVKKNLIVQSLKINYYSSPKFNPNNCSVFLHGWGSEAMHLKNVFNLVENFVALDLPGFGLSDSPKNAFSVKDYALLLKAVLEKLKIHKPILVGHSLGGRIIIKYTALLKAENLINSKLNPQKLILIASAGIKEKDNFKKKIIRNLAKAKSVLDLPLIKKFKHQIKSKLYSTIRSDYYTSGDLRETYLKVISEDLSSDMKKIETETVLIWGEDDQDSPLENGKEMNRLIKNSKLYIVEDAGHFVFIDKPKEFSEIFKRETHPVPPFTGRER